MLSIFWMLRILHHSVMFSESNVAHLVLVFLTYQLYSESVVFPGSLSYTGFVCEPNTNPKMLNSEQFQTFNTISIQKVYIIYFQFCTSD